MFKKLQDQFSKGLLDAVSGVLKNSPKQIEEKAVNKHGHDHPGKEDHDVDNDGDNDSTDSYLKNRRKAIAKNMSMKKEEVEQIDELSKDTMKSYKDNAAWDKDYETGAVDPKARERREKGIAMANKKLAKEEVEELDELSIGTMKSYGDKRARTVFSGGRKPGQSVDAGIAQKSRQSNSLSLARTKINRARDTGSTVLNKEQAETVTEAPVDGVAAGSMEGDKHLCATKVFHKEWAEGTPIFSQHAEPDFLGNIAWYDVMFEHGIERQVPTAEMEILMAESHMMHKKKVKEEVEELDELSKDTMLKYLSANKKSASGGMGDKEATKRMRGADMAVRKYTARDNKYVRVPATEEVELDEARGRPKKAAAKDFTVHPITKQKLMHNNPEHMKTIGLLQKNKILEKPKVEAGQHIMNQLQKAKTSMLGGSTIHFTHGESQHVSGSHAAKLITKYQGMKPAEKEDFQKKISHSHEKLKSEL